MDGWEDDDDLEIDSQENGWNDDTVHLDLLPDGDNDEKGEWSFDDDEILDDDDDDVDETKLLNEGNKTQQAFSVAAAAPAIPTDKCLRNNLGIVADKVVPTRKQNQRKEQEQYKEPADEWDFEDNDIGEEELAEPPAACSQKEEALFQSLVRYLDSLPAILPSLNAVLEAEYNTYQHAKDLNDYYKSRPQLYDYTLETELPRMDYEVVLPNNEQKRLTKKDEIKHYLLSCTKKDDNILIRASNQSLLADLLTVLTGPDCFIQHQYLATAMAQKCHFVIHPTLMVECFCDMHLSLPTTSGDRMDVARLELSIQFDQSPSITYRLHQVERLLHDLSALRDTAALLSSMMHNDVLLLQEEEEILSENPNVVRDAFLARLSQTQQFVEASHHGLSSAWKQIDSVANVSSKLDFIKKGLTLPSTESVLASSEVTTAFESSVPRAATFPRSAPPAGGVAKQASANPPPPPLQGNVNRGPPPPPPPLHPQDRPAPILGGLLRSGWNRLAQSVTLPDEEEVYFHSDNTQVIPKLYRSENEVTKNASQSKPPIIQGTPRRHVQDAPVPSPKVTNHDPISSLPSANVRDGWDDDDGNLDLDLDDDDDLMPEKTNSRPPQTVAPPRPPPPPAVPRPPKVQPRVASPPRTMSPLAVALPEYNPEDDIMPSRKRWVNPRPGNRQIQTR